MLVNSLAIANALAFIGRRMNLAFTQ